MQILFPTSRSIPLPPSRATNNAALDGLRGIAIVSVISYHFRLWEYPGPVFGVDLFFALSGFLITGSLLREHERNDRISILGFYMRRVRRLLPALLTMLIGYLLACLYFKPTLGRSLLEVGVVLSGVSNWTRAIGWRFPTDLGHTWSLAIEIQFCLLIAPLVLLLTRALRTMEAIAAVFLALALGLTAIHHQLAVQGASFARLYNGLDTRLVPFLLASSFAALFRGNSNLAVSTKRFISEHAFLIGLIASAAHVALAQNVTLREFVRSALLSFVVPVSCVLIIVSLSLRPSSILASLLGGRCFTLIGALSYGLYLWHYPILHLLRLRGVDSSTRLIIVSSLTIIAATASYYFVERRFLRKSPGPSDKNVALLPAQSAELPTAHMPFTGQAANV